MSFRRYVLASRSPRRLELLKLVVHPELIEVRPPHSTDEAGFENCRDLVSIRVRMADIARHKAEQIRSQLNAEESSLHERPRTLVISADTTVVVHDSDQRPFVLGQPPDSDDWRETVRGWFLDYYFRQPHLAMTAICAITPDGRCAERVVETRVTFRTDVSHWLNWYLLTGESRGKAGGYALQGAGSIFAQSVEGSLTNVVGLPLEALLEVFAEVSLK